MGFAEDTSHAAEHALGQAKEAVGALTGSDGLRRDGQREQAEASVKAAVEDVPGEDPS